MQFSSSFYNWRDVLTNKLQRWSSSFFVSLPADDLFPSVEKCVASMGRGFSRRRQRAANTDIDKALTTTIHHSTPHRLRHLRLFYNKTFSSSFFSQKVFSHFLENDKILSRVKRQNKDLSFPEHFHIEHVWQTKRFQCRTIVLCFSIKSRTSHQQQWKAKLQSTRSLRWTKLKISSSNVRCDETDKAFLTTNQSLQLSRRSQFDERRLQGKHHPHSDMSPFSFLFSSLSTKSNVRAKQIFVEQTMPA